MRRASLNVAWQVPRAGKTIVCGIARAKIFSPRIPRRLFLLDFVCARPYRGGQREKRDANSGALARGEKVPQSFMRGTDPGSSVEDAWEKNRARHSSGMPRFCFMCRFARVLGRTTGSDLQTFPGVRICIRPGRLNGNQLFVRRAQRFEIAIAAGKAGRRRKISRADAVGRF